MATGDLGDGLDRADVVVGRQHPQRGHVVAEQVDLARGQLDPVLAGVRGRSSSGSSTSVTFCT